MRSYWDTHAFQYLMILLDKRTIDRHARIIDDPVRDPEGISLRHPAIVVHGACPAIVTRRVELVNGDDLARTRRGQEVVVLESPPRRGVAAEGAARKSGVAAMVAVPARVSAS